MGFRFRRSFGLLPGVRINVGRRGPSVSLGVRGAHVTVGPTGVRKTVGIPGTGMSYTEHTSWDGGAQQRRAPIEQPVSPATGSGSGNGALGWFVAAVLFVMLIGVVLAR